MESKIDNILKQLHQYQFADSQQIIIELKHYVFDDNHDEKDLAFISSKLFNSSESVLEFLRKNCLENDKLVAGIKKRIYDEILILLSHRRPATLQMYLKEIHETCVVSFKKDRASLVKDSALKMLLRIIEEYPVEMIEAILDPKILIQKLLDEIKERNPSASVKGSIWNTVGQLHKKFGRLLEGFLIESQDQMFQELLLQFKKDKPEIKAMTGILKGLRLSLEYKCSFDDDEKEQLFIRVKIGMMTIPEIKQKGIIRQSMKLFSTHVSIFKKLIPRHAIEMLKLTLQLSVDTDMEVRDSANDMLGKLMGVISEGLIETDSIHKDLFDKIMKQFQGILEVQNQSNIQLISAIKAIGVFSKAIKTFLGDDLLLKYLTQLIDLSELKMVKEFEQQANPNDDIQNFKYILKKQKQLFTYIESYSFILLELNEPPEETVMSHFFKVSSIGVQNHRKLYDKYKYKFYDSLAALVMSLSKHSSEFSQWNRKFVRKTLQETLKIPDAAIFGGESPEESLKDAIMFWREWLNKEELMGSHTCRLVYDELIHAILQDITEVNLSYRVVKKGASSEEGQVVNSVTGFMSYQADNENHQQYLKRLADFLEVFVPSCHQEWFLRWIPQMTDVLIKKCRETPRIPRLYQILMTCMQACNKFSYFSNISHLKEAQILNQEPSSSKDELSSGEKINVFNRLLTFFKDLTDKQEEYQDELLISCIDLLLQVPIDLLYNNEIGTDNIEIWKGTMLKALEIGHINNGVAMTCVKMLEQWFNTLPLDVTVRMYSEILPKLSDYLVYDQDQPSSGKQQTNYFHQIVLEKETEFGRTKYKRKDVCSKVLDLLGKIGGYAHNIISNELSKKHDRENYIRWDTEKRLQFTLPLYTAKVDIYLDSCLPRIVDLAQNSNKKEIRIAACEFLHSLIIYMIGKNAQKPKIMGAPRDKNQQAIEEDRKHQELAAFSKLYAKLFPVIIKLASEIEPIQRQLFEPLCKQIVRWFSQSKVHEHPEVASLLDSLIDGAQNKNNPPLRQLCSDCIALFANWSLKQMTDSQIKDKPDNIKSLLRRVCSNSSHPDPYKRLASVLCLSKIFNVIREFPALVDRFCLEICFQVLVSLRYCYEKTELSTEVVDISRDLLRRIKDVILRNWEVLKKSSNNREIVPDLTTMMIFLFVKFKAKETVYRHEAIKMWKELVTLAPPTPNPTMKKPNDLKSWIVDYYCVHMKKNDMLTQMQELDFSPSSIASVKAESTRKELIQHKRQQFDQLTAQLEFMQWLLETGNFSFSQLKELKFNSSAIAANINSFLMDSIRRKFAKNSERIISQGIVSKEDKETLTKSKIVVVIKIFKLLNLAFAKGASSSDEKKLFDEWATICLQGGLEFGLKPSSTFKTMRHQFFVELAIFVCLVPQIMKLQLLVEDKKQESELRKECLKYLENYIRYNNPSEDSMIDEGEHRSLLKDLIYQKLTDDVKIISIDFLTKNPDKVFNPKMLINICLGYLKLSALEPELKEWLLLETQDISSNEFSFVYAKRSKQKVELPCLLKALIEGQLSSDSPFQNELGRIMVRFVTELGVSNYVLLNWLTQKSQVYLKCSDILLKYLAKVWADPQPPMKEARIEQLMIETHQVAKEAEEAALVAQAIKASEEKEKDEDGDHILGGEEEENKLSQSSLNQMTEVENFSCVGEFLVSKIPKNQASLYSLFIPIIETLEETKTSKQSLDILIKYVPKYCTSDIRHEFKDVAINQIKMFCLIANHGRANLQREGSEESQTFIRYLCERIRNFLKDKFSVYVKREVINLISITSDLRLNSVGQYQQGQTLFDVVEPTLKYAMKIHFPLKSRDLDRGSNEDKNFQVIIQSFLSLAVITCNLRVVRSLYNIISEMETSFEPALRNSLDIMIKQQLNHLPEYEFLAAASKFMEEFMNRDLDRKLDDNVRWAIAKKIILRILETCPQDYLTSLIEQWSHKLLASLQEERSEFESDPHKFYLLVREQTYVMRFFEIVYRRLPAAQIKDVLHLKLYGESTEKNELTKELIKIGAEAKRQPIPGFKDICRDTETKRENGDVIRPVLNIRLATLNSVKVVQHAYNCEAYSMLSSIIVCTQKNEPAFAKFLFKAKQGEGIHSMWSLLVPDDEESYNFKVQTNFNHIELKSIEQKLREAEQGKDYAEVKVANLIQNYMTSSFLNGTSKFNSNQVFETQMDTEGIQQENQKLQEIYSQKYKGQQQSRHSSSQDQNMGGHSQKEGEEPQPNGEEGGTQFELDEVNKHLCMKNIKRCVDKMRSLFQPAWTKKSGEQPEFAKYLLEEFSRPDVHKNIRIFILKIVMNNPNLFKQYAKVWFGPICEFIASQDTGGKGFHYFLRDICTMLINWHYVPPASSTKMSSLLSKVINFLNVISADKVKLIFKQNIYIISTLMKQWRKFIVLNKATLCQMLSMPDSKDQSHLWKMNAIEILALAVCYNIPVEANPERAISEQEPDALGEAGFQLQHSPQKSDPLLMALLRIFETNKKQIAFACAELLGMIMNHLKAKENFIAILDKVKEMLAAIDIKERHDLYLHIIERISREYKELLVDRQVFQKTLGFVNIMTGSLRASIFNSLEQYIGVCRKNNKVDEVNEICMSIQAVSNEILTDINDENQQAFLQMLICLQELPLDSVFNLLRKVIPFLKPLFTTNKNEYSRGKFYDLMVNLYDRYSEFKEHAAVRGALIHGLADESKMIKDKLAEFWHNENRLELDPLKRLQQLMSTLYQSEEEAIWLNNSAFLLLNVTAQSSDFERKIFEHPLQECQFTPLHLTMSNSSAINRSQPMTPLYTQINQMIEASQQSQEISGGIPAASAEDEEAHSQTSPIKDSSRQQDNQINTGRRNPNDSVQHDLQQRQEFNKGFIRATLPQFTQTQIVQPSLIANLRSGMNEVQATLSESFYEINAAGRGANQNQGESGGRDAPQQPLQERQEIIYEEPENEDNENYEGAPQQGHHSSQDSDGFIAPAPIKRKTNQKFKQFFKQNDYYHRPLERHGQRLRYIHEATMPASLARQEEIRRIQRAAFIDNQVKKRKNQVNLYRSYRTGELPDIQIDFKDMLKPLMAIVRADSTIATELMVEVFMEIYKSLKNKEEREKLGNGLTKILSSSQLYDYSTINCLHRIALELLKIDGFVIDSSIIQRTGQHSMSFQTSLLLLEESLIKGNINPDEVESPPTSQTGRRRRKVEAAQSSQNSMKNGLLLAGITNGNREYWFRLIKLYETIGNQDALHGIWSQLMNNESIMIKLADPAQEEKLEQVYQQQEEVVNVIKKVQELKNKGKIADALRIIEQTLQEQSGDFEDAIQAELQNKKYTLQSELLKWTDIAGDLSQKHSKKQLFEIATEAGQKQIDLMIRSQIRSEESWASLTDQVNFWMKNDLSKTALEKNYNYELSMLFLTQQDFDRARIYIEREVSELLGQWKNLTKLSQVAQHFLVQRIQKIYETKEFLNLIKKDDPSPAIMESLQKWKHRIPSTSFDPLTVWDDIYTARLLFFDLYKRQIGSLSSPATKASLQDTNLNLYIQTAKGALKMGDYDTSERYLKRYQKEKTRDGPSDIKIVLPIVKLRFQQEKNDIRNIEFEGKVERVSKILKVFSSKMENYNLKLSHPNFNLEGKLDLNDFANVKTICKSNIMMFELQKKLISISLDQSHVEKRVDDLNKYTASVNANVAASFEILDHLKKFIGNDGNMAYKLKQQGKILYRYAKFSDKLLRKMEREQTAPHILLKNALSTIDKSQVSLAKAAVENGIKALNLSFKQASDIIPRLLDIVSSFKDDVREEFQESSRQTPAWLFLRWINQIAAIINRPESEIFSDFVKKIASEYPHAMIYPFKVIESNLNLFTEANPSYLFSTLKYSFKKFELLNKWMEALDCLIFPEHKFRYWYQQILDSYNDPAMQPYLIEAAQNTLSQKQSQDSSVAPVENVLSIRIRKLVTDMYNDLMFRNKKAINGKIGKYNSQFITKWQGIFLKGFGEGGRNIEVMSLSSLIHEVNEVNKKMNKVKLFQGNEVISKYSEWLSELDLHEFYKQRNYIEIPGQYDNVHYQQPFPSKNVKVANLKKTCLVLGSIRRPKKITIHGSNEKDYNLLIKGGEDLRLDQRIQQLLGIMNRIFSEDPSCQNRDLNLKTFKVVPISNRLGSLEWVDNTEPMKQLISNEHRRVERGLDLFESRAYTQRINWLKELPKNKGKEMAPAQLHLALLEAKSTEVEDAFNRHQHAFPFYLLRNALENLCLTSSAFLTIKNQFIKSIATFSIAAYLLGIGDRHLENFLIDISDGEILGIDFGYAFGSSISLSIPELMPFRLTQQIEGVIAPHPLDGIYKQTMVHVLSAMRKKKSLLLDSCKIFIKEPLLDWVKDAKQNNRMLALKSDSESMSSAAQQSSMGGDTTITTVYEEMSWYPTHKINILKEKLHGGNPTRILSKELKETTHAKRNYFNTLLLAVQGQKSSLRYKMVSMNEKQKKKYLDAEDQVDILIEMARDPNILGRTWIGWSPYI